MTITRPRKQFNEHDSAEPIAIRMPFAAEKALPGFIDLTWRKVGRLMVIGMALEQKKMWVVHCTCGTYSLRSAKAIKNPKNTQDMCERCRYLDRVKYVVWQAQHPKRAKRARA